MVLSNFNMMVNKINCSSSIIFNGSYFKHRSLIEVNLIHGNQTRNLLCILGLSVETGEFPFLCLNNLCQI